MNTSDSILSEHSMMNMNETESMAMIKSDSMKNLVDISNNEFMFIPKVEEVQPSSIVLRRGYLKFWNDKEMDWTKKYVVRSKTNIFSDVQSDYDIIKRLFLDYTTSICINIQS